MKNKDKCLGAYIGAAIGDAMGGPGEGRHFEYIRRNLGQIEGLVDYTIRGPSAGYCMSIEAGNVTDDTFIRRDFTEFLLKVKQPRTMNKLVDFLLENADFDQWWAPSIPVLLSIKQGKKNGKTSGINHSYIGGIGWWTPFAILYAGDPKSARNAVLEYAVIWKNPFELDMLGAVIAGMAESLKDEATFDSIINTILKYSGPLAKKYINRAIEIAKNSKDVWELARNLYDRVLIFEDPSKKVDGELPPEIKGEEYVEGSYAVCYYGEQVALAIAAFVYAKGSVEAIPICCLLGRDSDSTATTVGAWVGGLHGLSGIPKEWSDTVCKVNKDYLDIYDLAEKIYLLEE